MKGGPTRLVWLAVALCGGCGDPSGGDGPAGGSNPDWDECRAEDADGDGTADAIEAALGTDPGDPADDPAARGMVVFVISSRATATTPTSAR